MLVEAFVPEIGKQSGSQAGRQTETEKWSCDALLLCWTGAVRRLEWHQSTQRGHTLQTHSTREESKKKKVTKNKNGKIHSHTTDEHDLPA